MHVVPWSEGDIASRGAAAVAHAYERPAVFNAQGIPSDHQGVAQTIQPDLRASIVNADGSTSLSTLLTLLPFFGICKHVEK